MNDFIFGFLLSGSMIIAIGAQNVFVLRNALQRQHIFLIACTCFLCDFLLMGAGVFFVGGVIGNTFWLTLLLSLAAIVFLSVYGFYALRTAIRANYVLDMTKQTNKMTPRQALLATLAISLLNPHVYLDTVVVVGGLAAQLTLLEKYYFISGALLASALWFFSLAYFSKFALRLFKSKLSWRILDTFIAFFMWFLVFNIALYLYKQM